MAGKQVRPTDEEIINAVRRLNAGYKNTEYSVRARESLGRGQICTVVFKGPDGA